MRKRPMLQTIACRRGCGRQLASLTRSLFGANAAHAQYAGICDSCMSAEERADMERAILQAAVLSASGLTTRRSA